MTAATSKAPPRVRAAEAAVASYAEAFPSAHTDFPWGERAVKVKKKVFLFMSASADGLSLSVKLPASGDAALALPFTQPTGYGLGKSGWVTAKFTAAETVPLPLLLEWVAESYRAVAPVSVLKELDGAVKAAAAKKKGVKKKVVKKKAVKKAAVKEKAVRRR